MKCPSIFRILFFFFIFPRFNECEMQMSYANAMIGLTDALCTIVPQYVIDRLLTTDLDVNFLMNANKMWCKSRFFFISDANDPWRSCKCNFFIYLWCRCLFAISMMQMSHAMVQMQCLSMMVPTHVFTRDANVSLQWWRCKMSCGANAF